MAEPPRQGGILTSPMGWLKKLGQKKRAFERMAREGRVYVFSKTQLLGVVDLLDESQVGMRLGSPNEMRLRDAVYMLKPGYATVADLEMAWIAGDQAGYACGRVRSLRGFNPDPDIDHIRSFWTSIQMDHSLIAPGGAFGKAE